MKARINKKKKKFLILMKKISFDHRNCSKSIKENSINMVIIHNNEFIHTIN